MSKGQVPGKRQIPRAAALRADLFRSDPCSIALHEIDRPVRHSVVCRVRVRLHQRRVPHCELGDPGRPLRALDGSFLRTRIATAARRVFAEGAKDRPVVVFFYGGSWTTGGRGLYRFVGAALAERGIVDGGARLSAVSAGEISSIPRRRSAGGRVGTKARAGVRRRSATDRTDGPLGGWTRGSVSGLRPAVAAEGRSASGVDRRPGRSVRPVCAGAGYEGIEYDFRQPLHRRRLAARAFRDATGPANVARARHRR